MRVIIFINTISFPKMRQNIIGHSMRRHRHELSAESKCEAAVR